MKHTIRIFAAVLLCVVLLACLFACNQSTVRWRIDIDNHWQLDQNGNVQNKQDHKLKNDICSICHAEIVRYDDEIWVQRYNDRGDVENLLIYDLQRNLISNTAMEYHYASDGQYAETKKYSNDQLLEICKFTTVRYSTNSKTYLSSKRVYAQDGSSVEKFYDIGGYQIRQVIYKIDGSVAFDYLYVNSFNSNGLLSLVQIMKDDEILEAHEYEYDDFGNITVKKYYDGDVLKCEKFYTIVVDGEQTTRYMYMTKTYDAQGVCETRHYDKDGNEIQPEGENDEH